MNVYFATTGLWEEVQVIRKVRPPRLLCSYWYFKNKPLREFCDGLGYQPEILLDSGAYSAHTKGKRVNLLEYVDYIRANRGQLSQYITLDVISEPSTTLLIWDLLHEMRLNPVPVVHYGEELSVIEHYTKAGATLIALGGTVPIRDKRQVAGWCAEVKTRFPEVDFHLLGSNSSAILQSGALVSCDASTWYLQAVMGRPSTVPGKDRDAKMARAEVNMRKIMEVFNENSVPFTHRGLELDDSKV